MSPVVPPVGDDTNPGVYSGPLRRRGLDPLQLGGLIVTIAIHVGAIAFVVKNARAEKIDKEPDLNVMVTKLVRKGVQRDKKLLPQRYVPPKPTAPVKGPVVTHETKAPPAKKEKRRDREADPDKILRERMERLRRQHSNQPPLDTQPEGSPTGSTAGTADTASQGDPCATAIHNAVASRWSVPETISERQAARLSARVRVEIGRDGAMRNPQITDTSGNPLFDDRVLSAIEQAGRDAESKSAIAKECGKKLPFRPRLRFNGKDLKDASK